MKECLGHIMTLGNYQGAGVGVGVGVGVDIWGVCVWGKFSGHISLYLLMSFIACFINNVSTFSGIDFFY